MGETKYAYPKVHRAKVHKGTMWCECGDYDDEDWTIKRGKVVPVNALVIEQDESSPELALDGDALLAASVAVVYLDTYQIAAKRAGLPDTTAQLVAAEAVVRAYLNALTGGGETL